MDVEGSEPRVLAGLTRPVATLSFEYLPTSLQEAHKCVARLETLGAYRYNFSIAESYRLSSERWLTASELMAALETPSAQKRAGDVYARLNASRP